LVSPNLYYRVFNSLLLQLVAIKIINQNHIKTS
jgi:hypothetical protein